MRARTIRPETQILAISGSLRRDSHNTALLRAAFDVAPTGVIVDVLDGLAELPHYDADLEAAGVPAAIEAVRLRVDAADAVLFATPEYNGSVPGALKNAVDWLSRPRGTAVLAGKAVTVIGASPGQYGAQWAQADLRRILGIAGARVIGEELPVARVSQLVDEDGALTDPTTRELIEHRLDLLVREAALLSDAA